ncbi:AmmeMemoRadiSam system protein B, partial [Candidatus Babeliales bacterium]|nr:AmmeMemoRadiSam system protein B [Candidatus Babeliales bacterium]
QVLEKQFAFAKKHLSLHHNNPVKAIISPHAGITYSGIAAASAYKELFLSDGKKNNKFKLVIILAPSHSVSLHGIALPDFTHYKINLGTIEVDTKTVNLLKKNKLFKTHRAVFQKEHSLEMQLPFIETTLKNYSIVPLIVGHLNDNEVDQVAQTLNSIIDSNTLVICTSDFTHYGANYGYQPFTQNTSANVKALDSVLIKSLLSFDRKKFEKTLEQTQATICGKTPLRILLALLNTGKLSNTTAELTSYYTSAHIKGPETSLKAENLFKPLSDAEVEGTVGYAGIVFVENKNPSLHLSGYEQQSLLTLAKASIQNTFDNKLPLATAYPVITHRLRENRGAFVTIETTKGDLRGCIGRIETNEPLVKTIVSMSKAAAFQDSRFTPLKKTEIKNTKLSINILTKPRKIDSYKKIQLGKHGIIFEKTTQNSYYSSVFLPNVPTELGWTLQHTLEQLSKKAGLDNAAWQKNAQFSVFESQKFQETP